MDSTLEAAFRQFDADGNGTLDESELAAAYEAAGRPIPNDKLRRIIKMLDTNGDGVIDMEVRAMPHGPFFPLQASDASISHSCEWQEFKAIAVKFACMSV